MSTAELSATKRALAAIQALQNKIDGMERERREPIAVIGMSCRFPGGADTPQKYWELLCAGRDAICEAPPQRWNIDEFYDPDPDAPGKTYTRCGGFLPEVDRFDPQVFGISPREAASIDPQQRLVLELAWEAFENANIPIESVYNSRTGVFVGVSNPEYSAHLIWSGDPTRINAYSGTGGSLGVAAGRLSYTLGLTGPSLIVDTACSSSLVTTHLACQSLRARECDMALSSGVNLIYGPETFINFSKAHMLSPDGRCKTFDAAADGYARGEGGGLVVLKRLSDAQRDGDKILAVIRGSAVNQDGPSGGLTVPNGPAQTKVIRQALEAGGVAPAQVGYVEAHGTGTALGDPIELRALGSAYGVGRDADRPLRVASVKTNFGHLESAAGIAGLIKAILVVQHGQVPPHLNFKQPSPHIPWAELPLTVPTRLQPWVDAERLAGVSSFSFSGTNAHVVVGNATGLTPQSAASHAAARGARWQLLPLSAKDDAALSALAAAWRERLTDSSWENDPAQWSALSRSAVAGRSEWPFRIAVAAHSPGGMAQRLTLGDAPRARAVAGGGGKVAFLFTGQGSQYHRMAHELYLESEVFRSALDECDALLRPRLGASLIELIYGDGDPEALNATAITQPVLFAIEYATMRLWQSFGVRPDAMLGHSVGEYAAACVAGVFSLEDAIGLIAERGRLMQTLCAPGAMVSVPLSEAETLNVIRPWSGEVAVATLNGPRNVVVSTNPLAASALAEGLLASGVDARPLRVSHAFHSPMMAPMLAPFAATAQQIKFHAPSSPIYSTLTGKLAREEFARADYWVRHVEAPVRFAEGMRALLDDGYRIFVEVGPKPTLCALGREIAASLGSDVADACVWLPSLRAGKPSWGTLFESLGALWVRGAEVNWHAVNGDGPRHVSLPNYPFQRRSCWIDWIGSHAKPVAKVVTQVDAHPLLGARLNSPALDKNTIVFTAELSPDSAGLLAHHRVFGAVVLPAAAHIEMVLAAAARLLPQSAGMAVADLSRLRLTVEDVAIGHALVLPDDETTAVQIVLQRRDDESYTFSIYSRPLADEDSEWRLNTTGRLLSRPASADFDKVDLNALRAECPTQLSVAEYYRLTHSVGIEHGERFQALEALWQGEGRVLAHLRLPEAVAADSIERFFIHPVLLDAAFQMLGVPLLNRGEPYLPVGVDALHRVQRTGTDVWCVVRVQSDTGQFVSADIDLVDGEGHVLAAVKSLRFQQVTRRALQGAARFRHTDWLYRIDWTPRACFAARADWMPDPDVLAQTVSSSLADTVASIADYGDFQAALSRLVAIHARAALEQLGWRWTPGQPMTLADVVQTLNIVPAHRRLLARLLAIMAEQGALSAEADGWRMNAVTWATPAAETAEIARRFAFGATELALVTPCGQGLAQALAGRIDGLQLLFPGGDFSAASRFYTDSPGARAINETLRRTVAAALAQLPPGRGLRVLEIGAGTGGTSAHLLPLLPAERCDYCFTDVSSGFMSRARERFRDYPFVEYKVLDIEKDPLTQGYARGGYDIVVAANAVHATRDLGATMAHASSLLAPGGWMVLLEGTEKQPWLDLTFGLTEGWWRFDDVARRPDYPLLDVAHWRQLLEECGLTNFAVSSPDRVVGRSLLGQSVLLARQPAMASALADSDWLVLADRLGVGAALARRLAAQGARCHVVAADEAVDSDALAARLAAYPHLRGVVHARALAQAKGESLDPATLDAAQHDGCRVLLDLVQAMARTTGQQAPQLVVVTQGAVGVGDHAPDVAQAPLWAMAQVAAVEAPTLDCLCVDLDPAQRDVEQLAATLCLELEAAAAASVLSARSAMSVAWRDGRYEPRLQRAEAHVSSDAALPVRADAMYLITGGLGDLGLVTARWLVEEKGARFLTLVGRRAPSAAAQQRIAAIEALGVQVQCMQADMADAHRVAQIVEAAARIAPLAGAIHAAGSLDDAALTAMNWSQVATVLAPKVAGAWNLHRACAAHSLDFFVMYSSLASVLAPVGQANYAAANGFLDALAHYRRSLGLPAMTINWGPWSAIGQAMQRTSEAQLRQLGMGAISPAQGVSVLAHVFDRPSAQVLVAAMDWDAMPESLAQRPVFANFRRHTAATQDAGNDGGLQARLQGLPQGEQRAQVLEAVKVAVARILGLESARVVEEDVGFFDMGMDSLTAVELRNALQAAAGVNLPTTLLFKYPTVQALTTFLADEIFGSNAAAPAASVAAVDAKPVESKPSESAARPVDAVTAESVSEMTDEELAAMIDAEMSGL